MELPFPFARPANMPLKSFSEQSDVVNQQIITQVFLNWLPLEMKLENYMRPLFSAVGGGELEYVFEDKGMYWRDTTEIYLPYLPYFSNCRGFGRTIPREPLAFESSSGGSTMQFAREDGGFRFMSGGVNAHLLRLWAITEQNGGRFKTTRIFKAIGPRAN
ncbi:unnamed protein product [Symbiodinium natans]|uniref:Uncharacterized protein n=1 Tax=Symbiodinium natans TaxID=878477 RepID=A0A812MC54_9DINO|nr:unnamed protein product [Symbiodinium natans]